MADDKTRYAMGSNGEQVELKATQIELKKHTILTLRFDMDAWDRIEKEICPLSDLGEKMTGSDRLRLITRLMDIMAVGEHPDVDGIWKRMWPGKVRECSEVIWAAINEGMNMENADDDDEPADVVLEELEKKDDQAG